MISFETKIRVEYHHTDQMGVVHHSNYVKFFEVARTEWLRANGLTYAEMERRGVMMPIVDVQVKYRMPAYYDELITVKAMVEELPMALECELVSYDIESNHMVGRIVNVSVDESVLGEDGNVDAGLLQPIVYDPVRLEYRVLGEKVGKAFSDGKKLL